MAAIVSYFANGYKIKCTGCEELIDSPNGKWDDRIIGFSEKHTKCPNKPKEKQYHEMVSLIRM